MKKILVMLLALVMVFSLFACKSKEQKAADEFLEKYEQLIDDLIAAKDSGDLSELTSLADELQELSAESADVAKDLKESDPDAAADFLAKIAEINAKWNG